MIFILNYTISHFIFKQVDNFYLLFCYKRFFIVQIDGTQQ